MRARRENAKSRTHPVVKRRAIVLVIVLIVVAMLALGAYTFSDLMLTEREAVDAYGHQLQAQALAESGVDAARVFLMSDWETRSQRGGVYDNPARFRGIPVNQQNPNSIGRFTLLAPNMDEGALGGVRYGLENESTRLNLNALLLAEMEVEDGGRELLQGLPGMTESIADAILDWIDDDDEIREFGAEREYYSGLDPPYEPRNGPLETVEELLLVRGVTPELLFGRDINRNGMVDQHEQAMSLPIETGDTDAMDRGWSAYLTLYSQERNVNAAGEPRIYVNMEDMRQLHAQLSARLPQEWADFIVAYRQNGPYRGRDTETESETGSLDLSEPGRFTLVQVIDLIGARTRVKFEGDEEASVLESPFPDEPLAMRVYLPRLAEDVTVYDAPTIPGRIDINQASRVVLSGVPFLDDEMIEEIMALRDPDVTADDPHRRHETWLLMEGVVTLDEMRQLMPFVTAGGDVYRTQTVGYFDNGWAFARAEVVIDATSPMPRVASWRDISHLGRGYALETLGVILDE